MRQDGADTVTGCVAMGGCLWLMILLVAAIVNSA